jgi:hypothetical protein
MLAGRPGPPGLAPRTVLAGLMLAVYYTGRATIADAWRILHYSLQPAARTWLGIPAQPPATAREQAATSRRLYRALDRITTLLDPARHDRRTRLPIDQARVHTTIWNSTEGRTAAGVLQRVANQLVLVPVRIAQTRGHLRGWRGDVGVDATAVPVLARPGSDRTGTASVEITAGWHYSGGSDHGVFGYSATLLVAAHQRHRTTTAKTYPQLCLGLVLDTPTVRTGPSAITALQHLRSLGFPAGTCAADRAYTGQAPEHFQTPARRLGYRLALDYKADERGPQGSWHGAVLVDGSLACPLTPTRLIDATHGADDKTIRLRSPELQEAITARASYLLKLKEGADKRGTVRLQCPAAGPSPSVNCPRRDRLRPGQARHPGPPPAVIDLTQTSTRTCHPAAKPTIHLPDQEWITPPPATDLPTVCGKSAITVPADAGGDWRVAKYRQDTPYLSPAWDSTYKPIRSHTEGINGRLKSGDLDIGNPKHRPAPGQVAQTLLTAIMITIGNLTILETWLHERTGTHLTLTDYESVPTPEPLTPLPTATDERSPPPSKR